MGGGLLFLGFSLLLVVGWAHAGGDGTPFKIIFKPLPSVAPQRRAAEGNGLVHAKYCLFIPSSTGYHGPLLETLLDDIAAHVDAALDAQGFKDLVFNVHVSMAVAGRQRILLTIEADYAMGLGERMMVNFFRVLVHQSLTRVIGPGVASPSDFQVFNDTRHQFVPVPRPNASEVASTTASVTSAPPGQLSAAEVMAFPASLGTEINVPWHLDRLDQRNDNLDGNYIFFGIGTGQTAYVIDTGVDVSFAAAQVLVRRPARLRRFPSHCLRRTHQLGSRAEGVRFPQPSIASEA